MSKHHQASRRRNYGRRRRELQQRLAVRDEWNGVVERDDAPEVAAGSAARELVGRFEFGYAD